MSGKGFQEQGDTLWVESMVASRTLTPAVKLQWGKQKTMLDPAEARHHAYAVLGAIAAAELDACLVQFLTTQLQFTVEDAVRGLQLFRQKRETEQLPSVTLNLGDEHIRPDTARQRGVQLLTAAFGVEAEAFLVAFFLQDLNLSAEQADVLIQEFRAMRGAVTHWPEEQQ